MNSASADPKHDKIVRGKRPGFIGRRIVQKMMRSAVVNSVEKLPGPFVMIELSGPALAEASWGGGQRVGLILDRHLSSRTFTPIDYDPRTRAVKFLIYVHGNGVASEWAWEVRKGDSCGFVGPVPSLEPARPRTMDVFFGDETSIATALCAGLDQDRGRRCVFETNGPETLSHTLASIGLGEATIIARTNNDSHLESIKAAIGELGPQTLSLTGNARSVQALHQFFSPCTLVRCKAYWARGKSGLT